jgi:hypothetical protein
MVKLATRPFKRPPRRPRTPVRTATHDIGLGSSGKSTKWFHRIDPHIDRERDRIKNELLLTGVANSYTMVDRKHVPKASANATADKLITDSKMLVLMLGPTSWAAK